MKFCLGMKENIETLLESLRRDGADAMTIRSHEMAAREWETRYDQSKLILNKLEQAA